MSNNQTHVTLSSGIEVTSVGVLHFHLVSQISSAYLIAQDENRNDARFNLTHAVFVSSRPRTTRYSIALVCEISSKMAQNFVFRERKNINVIYVMFRMWN